MPHKRNLIPHICEQCGTIYQAEAYRVQKGLAKHCSHACACRARTIRIEHVCEECGTTFAVRPSRITTARRDYGERGFRFCSRACAIRNRCNGVYEERQCEQCGTTFTFHVPPSGSPHETKNPGKYCSRECAKEGQKNRVGKACATCGKVFSVKRSRAMSAKYCSPECAGMRPPRTEQMCPVCGTEFSVTPSQAYRECCSVACAAERRRLGFYRDPLPGRARFSTSEWKRVRLFVIERDGGVCVRCGSHLRLAAHHIIPWRLCHEDSPENLITLCHNCHPIVEAETARIFFPHLLSLMGGQQSRTAFPSVRRGNAEVVT